MPILCHYHFPDPAAVDPHGDGLIAVGADLAADTLLCAYRQGLFPWFNEGEPIAWWSPEPRCIIEPSQFEPSKSLVRRIKNSHWTFTVNQAFSQVIGACAEARAYANDTWISPAMIDAYTALHQRGIAHSIEVWQQDTLIGGLYGLKIGQAFFGESMFHRCTDASKAAFFVLMRLCAKSHFDWVDCQLPNPHLISLGATTMTRQNFLSSLNQKVNEATCDWSRLCQSSQRLVALLQDGALIYEPHYLSFSPL